MSADASMKKVVNGRVYDTSQLPFGLDVD